MCFITWRKAGVLPMASWESSPQTSAWVPHCLLHPLPGWARCSIHPLLGWATCTFKDRGRREDKGQSMALPPQPLVKLLERYLYRYHSQGPMKMNGVVGVGVVGTAIASLFLASLNVWGLETCWVSWAPLPSTGWHLHQLWDTKGKGTHEVIPGRSIPVPDFYRQSSVFVWRF